MFAKFSHPRCIKRPAEEFPLEFCKDDGAPKTTMMPLPECQKTVTMCSFERHSSGIGQTDRRTELVKQYRVLHALHGDARGLDYDQKSSCATYSVCLHLYLDAEF